MLSNISFKESSTKKLNIPLGLCITCNNAGHCIMMRKVTGSIYYCEQFDNYVPVKSRKPKERNIVNLKPDVKIVSRKHLGLCRNCDNLHTCTHVIPEGGIWHCEDYQ